MKFKKILLLLALINVFNHSKAQKQIPLNDYSELFERSKELSQDGKFHEAYQELKKLNSNDSNYLHSLNNLAYYLLNNEVLDSLRYDDVLKITQEGLNNKDLQLKYYLYINNSTALLNQKKYKEAIAVIENGLKQYQKSYYLFYRKGLLHEALKEHANAKEMYIQSIIYNPFHAESHLKLGYLAYRSGNITEALMCFNIYLLLNPDGADSYLILETINTIVSTKLEIADEIDIKISEDDASFDEINLILNNHISLSKNYKTNNKINIALVKQNHLLLESLKNYEGNNGFFHKKYVEFYNWVRNSNQFDNFSYTICFAIKNEKYRKILDSKTSDIKEFIPIAYNKLGDIFSENEILLNGKTQTVFCLYDNFKMIGIGNMKDDKMVGYWETYHPTYGYLSGKGNLDDDSKKTGEWIWYYENGTIEEKSNYKAGNLDGLQEFFYENGQLKYTLTNTDGKANGEYRFYNKYGALTEKKVFKNGELDGIYATYFELGEDYPNYIIPYKADKVEGEVIRYYVNGSKSLTVTMTNDKKQGIEKEYYKNNNIYSETNYKDGLLEGPFKAFHVNGKTKTTGQFENGERIGEWKYYYSNGNIESECVYDKGKIVGEYKEYDIDGIHYQTYDYRKNDVYGFSFFDKTGKLIHSGDKTSGKLNYVGYFPNGNKTSEGIYNLKGGKEGLWKYYNNNGTLTGTSEFKENKLENKSIYYYTNGIEETTKNYKNDSLNGYCINRHLNGKINREGWYKDDLAQGVWKSYYPNGQLEEVNYYNNGKLNGNQTTYSITDDKVVSNLIYNSGKLISEDFYDDKGNIYMHTVIPTEKLDTVFTYYQNKKLKNKLTYLYSLKNGPFTQLYPNGKIKSEGNFLYGEKHGKWIWYYDNGEIDTEQFFNYGDLDGELKYYHRNGKLKEIKTYELGLLQGEEKEYNEKGILIGSLTYFNDEIIGKRKFYSQEGQLQLIRHYHNGQIMGYSYLDKNKEEVPMIKLSNETGKIVSYFDNGEKSREMTLEKGVFTGPYIEYYYNGQVYQDKFYKDNQLEGTSKTYYPTSTLHKEESYTNGFKNGKSIEYYENGALKKEVDYLFDVVHGKITEYSIDGKITKQETYFNDFIIFD